MSETKTPQVSVVLCTYNGAAYLQAQLATMLTQTRLPCELVVCDDRSSDATVAIVGEFAHKAPFPVRVHVNAENFGSTRNFDAAMQMAIGEYIALCDQDDVWYPEKLATLATMLDSNAEIGGVFSDADLISEDGKGATLFTQHGFGAAEQKRFNEDGAIDLLLQHDIVTGATLMVRASLRERWTPIPQSWVHDGWLAWMIAVHAQLRAVETPLMCYRIHAQQQLGVGTAGMEQRVQQIRRTERARYARVAAQFDDLRERLLWQGVHDAALLDALEQKSAFLRRRAEWPREKLQRVAQMLQEKSNYKRYARGWRSFRKDMLLD